MDSIQIPSVVLRMIIFFICVISIYLIFFKKAKKISEDKEKGIAPKEKYLIFLIVITSLFVVVKWNEIIYFEFFKSFNGGNLIFILWLFLILLPLFDLVEFPGIKLTKNQIASDSATNIINMYEAYSSLKTAVELKFERERDLAETEKKRSEDIV